MPQIWMTYEEIGSLIGCSVEETRALTIDKSLDRKKSRDGNTRVKLDAIWTALFIARLRQADPQLDLAIIALRETHGALGRGYVGSSSRAGEAA